MELGFKVLSTQHRIPCLLPMRAEELLSAEYCVLKYAHGEPNTAPHQGPPCSPCLLP